MKEVEMESAGTVPFTTYCIYSNLNYFLFYPCYFLPNVIFFVTFGKVCCYSYFILCYFRILDLLMAQYLAVTREASGLEGPPEEA